MRTASVLAGLALAATATLAPGLASAQPFELDYVGVRGGSLGLGAEVGFELIPSLSLRLVGNTFDFGYDTEASGVRYDGDLSLGSLGAQLDFKPIPLVPIYVTGGYFLNSNEIAVTGRPTTPTQIGNTVYTPAQIGTLTSTVSFDDTAPYLGLGVRFGLGPAQVALEAGGYRQGEARSVLRATGLLASDPAFAADLVREARALEDELDEFEVYPVLNLSLRYKF
jgi:hypothetical protein